MVTNEVLKGSRGLKFRGRSLRFGGKIIFNPQDKFLHMCNRLFVISCILAVSIDPLFLYLPIESENKCLGIDRELATTTTMIRTLIDAFYLFRMALQFRTASVAPPSGVFARGEPVIVPADIANRYLRGYFIIDLLSVLPIPQIIVGIYLISSRAAAVPTTKTALLVTLLIQYVPRFFRIFPLTSELKRSSGAFPETAWAAAAIYLLWYIVAGHIFGALWYYASSKRVDTCWHNACRNSTIACKGDFLYCGKGLPKASAGFKKWKTTGLGEFCKANNTNFDFGIFGDAVKNGVIKTGSFFTKYCYCLWWGVKNLSTLGQGLKTTSLEEVFFSISLVIAGLILFALLIGNMQTCLQSLQSLSKTLEEMRVKRNNTECTEQWMCQRQLPEELRERVRRYDRYKWRQTCGVDEESLVQSLPWDLKRDIKRHLCLDLVKRVPLFNNMDGRLLDAVCERLKPSLYSKRKIAEQRQKEEEEAINSKAGSGMSSSSSLGATIYVSRFATSALRGVHRRRNKVPKPPEPDFSADAD